MEAQNKLRIFRKEIKEYFIVDFAGMGEHMDYYVKVSLPQKWLESYGNHDVKKINVSDYEETLIHFIENPQSISPNHPLLIIIGGAGSGKSTSIKYALNNAKVCNGCPVFDSCKKDYPARVHLDFLNFKRPAEAITNVNDSKENFEAEKKYFWSYIAKKIGVSIGEALPIHEEFSSFWLWLLSGEMTGTRGDFLNQRLEGIIHLIKNPRENSVELHKFRRELYNNLSSEEYAYYKLYQVAYLRRFQKVNCNLLIYDNIDRLQPHFQVDLINFAIETNFSLECKAVIPMRPHTFHLNRDASDFIEIIEHCVPSMSEVVNTRLQEYKNNKGDEEVFFFMNKIVESINSNSIMNEVFHSTSGPSTRFALRNLYNLFLSPLIITHIDNIALRQIEFDTNIFFQAYFCTEAQNEKLFEANFVNILTIKNSKNVIEYSNIKLRCLHLLNKYSEIKVEEFVSNIESFGYSIEDIVTVTNEFLSDKKSLMYGNIYTEYDVVSIRKNKGHLFYVTPMGIGYYENLIRYPSYLYECIHSIDVHNRQKRLSLSMKRLSEIVKVLFDFDLDEVRNFCEKCGVNEYKKVFLSDTPCITSVLYFKMYPNFEILVRKITIENFDVYGNYIVKKMNELLGELTLSKK